MQNISRRKVFIMIQAFLKKQEKSPKTFHLKELQKKNKQGAKLAKKGNNKYQKVNRNKKIATRKIN